MLHILQILLCIFGYSLAFALENAVVFYEPYSSEVVVILQGKDLDFKEKNNVCQTFVETVFQVLDERKNVLYEKKIIEEFVLDETDNIPDDEELFLRKYTLPDFPPSSLIYVFLNDKHKPFFKSLRVLKKSFVKKQYVPQNFSTGFFLSEILLLNLNDTLKIHARSRENNRVLLVSLLFSDENKFIELASYTWYLRKRKEFQIPLKLFSEGKYSLLVLSGNKKNILLKTDFFIFSEKKYHLLKQPSFVTQVQNYYFKVFKKKLPRAPSKKEAEIFYENLLHYDFQNTSLKQFISAFAGQLHKVSQYKNFKLYSQDPFYYLLEQTSHYENIRIP